MSTQRVHVPTDVNCPKHIAQTKTEYRRDDRADELVLPPSGPPVRGGRIRVVRSIDTILSPASSALRNVVQPVFNLSCHSLVNCSGRLGWVANMPLDIRTDLQPATEAWS